MLVALRASKSLSSALHSLSRIIRPTGCSNDVGGKNNTPLSLSRLLCYFGLSLATTITAETLHDNGWCTAPQIRQEITKLRIAFIQSVVPYPRLLRHVFKCNNIHDIHPMRLMMAGALKYTTF